MGAANIFSVNFSEKKDAFFHGKLLNGMIFAERERERERVTTDTSCVAFWCARTLKIIATTCFYAVLWLFLFPIRITV